MAEPRSYWRSDAICLRVVEYSNTSLVASYFTRERGRVGALAKGARRRGSAFFGELEPLTRQAIVAIARRTTPLHTLVESAVTSTWRPVRHDLRRLHAALYVIELLGEVTVEGQPEPVLFDLAVRALDRIAHNKTFNPLTVIIFELRGLAAIGLGPRLDRCAECGAALDGAGEPGEAGEGAGPGESGGEGAHPRGAARAPRRDPVWAPILGGVACARCAPRDRDRRSLSAEGLRALRALAAPDGSPRARAEVAAELRGHLDAYVAARLERRLRLAPYLAGSDGRPSDPARREASGGAAPPAAR